MSPFDRLPGGNIGFPAIDKNSPVYEISLAWKKIIGDENYGFNRDPDFIAALNEAIPDPSEQKQYLTNTVQYLLGENCNLDYVLVFRRTLPSSTPKSEEHWTTSYMTAVSSLYKQMSESYGLHSCLLVATVGMLSRYGYAQDQESLGQSNGEIKIINTPVDQSLCLFSFRPEDQQRRLDKYLSEGGATLTELSQKLQQKHSSD